MIAMDVPAKQDPMTAALLEQLRDVVRPDPAPWWPPAPGWWLVAAVVVLAIFLIARAFIKRQQKNRYRIEAASLLVELGSAWKSDRDTQAYASAAHQLVRRAAIHVAGRDAISRLTGRAFVEYVNTLSKAPLSAATGALLTEFSYRPATEDDLDIEQTQQDLAAWLNQLERPRDA